MSLSPRYLISFRHAALFVEVDAAGFQAAKDALTPFLAHDNNDADAYAAACQAVEGQEYSLRSAIDCGLLGEDGEPWENVEIFQAE